MTPGMIFGFIIAYNNEHLDEGEKEEDVKPAAQADFDSF